MSAIAMNGAGAAFKVKGLGCSLRARTPAGGRKVQASARLSMGVRRGDRMRVHAIQPPGAEPPQIKEVMSDSPAWKRAYVVRDHAVELTEDGARALVMASSLEDDDIEEKPEKCDLPSGPPHAVSSDTVTMLSNAGIGAATSYWGTLFIKGIIAGCWVGLGGTLCSTVGGDCPQLAETNPGMQRGLFGALGFPLSIFLVTTIGGAAFTGGILMVMCAVLTNRLEFGDAMKALAVSAMGNYVGLLGIAALVTAGGMDCVTPCAAIAQHKAAATWAEVFFRGVGGGALVCLAISQAFAAKAGIEKIVGIWFCISTYVMCGWEHGLANMFFFPVAIWGSGGAAMSWSIFFNQNLIPSTLGNLVGGSLLALGLVTIHGAQQAFEPPKTAAGVNDSSLPRVRLGVR